MAASSLLLVGCSATVSPTTTLTLPTTPWTRLPDADALHQMLPFGMDSDPDLTMVVGRFEDGQGGYEDHPAFATSRDDATWTRGVMADGPTTGVPVAVTGSGTSAIAVGIDRCRFFVRGGVDASEASTCQAAIWHSTDGAAWNRVADDRFEAAALTSVIDFDGLAVAAGARGDRAVVFVSSDARAWEEIEGAGSFDGAVIVGLASRPGRLVAIGYQVGAMGSGSSGASAPVSWTSTDGRSWAGPVRLPAAPTNGFATAIASHPSGFVAVGDAPRLEDGYVTGRQPLAWSSPDGLAWTATPIETTAGFGELIGVGGDSDGSMALGSDPGGIGPFLEGARRSGGWYLQALPDALRSVLGEARAISSNGTRYLIAGAAQAADFSTTAIILSGHPGIEGGGPLPSVAPAATDEIVPVPSADLPARLDGTLQLTGAVTATLAMSGSCSAVVTNTGVLFGEGTLGDGRNVLAQLDFLDDRVGMQLFVEGGSKDSAIIGAAPIAKPPALPTPPSGTIDLAFAMPDGTANGVLIFRCNR